MFLVATFPHPGPDGSWFDWLKEFKVLVRKKLKRFLPLNLGLGVEPLLLFQPRGIASILGKIAGLSGWAAINARHALLIEHLFYIFWRIRLGPSPSMGLAHSCPPRQAKPRLIAPTRVPFLTNLFYFPQLLIHTAEFDFGFWECGQTQVPRLPGLFFCFLWMNACIFDVHHRFSCLVALL